MTQNVAFMDVGDVNDVIASSVLVAPKRRCIDIAHLLETPFIDRRGCDGRATQVLVSLRQVRDPKHLAGMGATPFARPRITGFTLATAARAHYHGARSGQCLRIVR